MSHDKVAGLLPDYLAGELDRASEERLERHMRECEECRTWLETAEFLEEALSCQCQVSSAALARFAASPESVETPERRQIEEHLEICGLCRGEFTVVQYSIAHARNRPSGQHLPRLFTGWVSRQPLAAALVAGFVALAAFGTWFTVSEFRPEGQEPRRHHPVRGEEIIVSDGELLVEELEVEDGGHLLVRASHSVAFGNGFKVGPGGRLTVEAGGATASTRR